KGFGGHGVVEVVEDFDGDTYRAAYPVRFARVDLGAPALQKKSKLTQSAAAKLTGVTQGDLSKVCRGQLRGYSEAKLIRMLAAFDQDVEITTRPHRKAGKAGRIIFTRRTS